MLTKGSVEGEVQEPRVERKAPVRRTLREPGREGPAVGADDGRRRTSVSTTLCRNGSGKGRAEPGMKASKKEEGHLVGREITKAQLEISRGPPRAGTVVTLEGVSCGTHPPAVRAPPTQRAQWPFLGRCRARSQAHSPAQTGASSRRSRVLLAGAAWGRDLSPLWSSPVLLFLTFPNRLSCPWLPPEPGPLRPRVLRAPLQLCLPLSTGQYWDLLQGCQGADGPLSWTGLSSQGSRAGCWRWCVENASPYDSGGGRSAERVLGRGRRLSRPP